MVKRPRGGIEGRRCGQGGWEIEVRRGAGEIERDSRLERCRGEEEKRRPKRDWQKRRE
jgi:hypothetical protein